MIEYYRCYQEEEKIRGKSPDELRQIFHLPDKPVVTDDVEIGS